MGFADPKWRSPAANNVFVAFTAVAVWSCIPLTIRLMVTLKHRRGLYFWSIIVTSWGLCIRALGYMLTFLVPNSPWYLGTILAQAGWVAMVSGFSTVLYSRLNLIMENQTTRRRILIMIVLNGLVFHTAMVTISVGSAAVRNTKPGHPQPAWGRANTPLERIQIIVFSGQECLLSFFYVRAAYQYLRSRFVQRGKIRKTMCLLLGVQVIIIIVDIALIAVDFADLLMLKLFIHSFIYSVKLELEFVVLNQLVELSQMGVPGLPSFSNSDATTPGGESTRHLGGKTLDWTPTQSPRPESLTFGGRDSTNKRPTMIQRTSSTLEQIPESRAIDVKSFLDLDKIGVIPST